MPAIITAPPVLFDPINFGEVSRSSFGNPAYNSVSSGSQSGPYKINGAQYIVLWPSAGTTTTPLQVQRSTDSVTWTIEDAAHAPIPTGAGANIQGVFAATYNSSLNNIAIVYNEHTTGNDYLVLFDCTTNLYGTPTALTTSSVTGNQVFQSEPQIFYQNSGTVWIFWVFYVGPGANADILSVSVTSGVCSSVATIVSHTLLSQINVIYSGVLLSDSSMLLTFEDDTNDPVIDLYSINISSTGTPGSPVLIYATTGADSDSVNSGTMLVNGLDFLFTFQLRSHATNDTSIYIATGTPLANPSWSVVQVIPTQFPTNNLFFPNLIVDKNGNPTLFFIVQSNTPINGTAQIWITQFITGSWNTPVLFYDVNANPPTGYTLYRGTDAWPYTVSGYEDSDGWHIQTTIEVTEAPDKSVSIYLSDSSTPPATQIIPEFPANPYPPPPYCIINKLVMYEVITNGSDTSAVLQTNLDVSAQNLSYGFPTVTFEMLDAAAYSATPYVISKSANTVTIGFSAVAASFRVVIDETNTLLR